MHHDYKKHMIVSELWVKCSLEKKTSGSIMKKAFIQIDYDGINIKQKFLMLCCERTTISVSTVFYQ
jgi:hypothetical protein